VETYCLTPVIVLSLLYGWCVVYVGDASVVEQITRCKSNLEKN
jgi:hypothetical protein